jgi:hypothetical protein
MMAALMAHVCSSYNDDGRPTELCQEASEGEKFAKYQSENLHFCD